MTKELKALKEIGNHKIKYDVNIKYYNGDETHLRFENIRGMFPNQFALIETALKRLEKLEKSKPSKELKKLKNTLKETFETLKNDKDLYLVFDKQNGKEDLFFKRFSELSDDNTLRAEKEKLDKILRIIIEKDVNLADIRCCSTVEQYNVKENGNIPLTKEEFELLKEVGGCAKDLSECEVELDPKELMPLDALEKIGNAKTKDTSFGDTIKTNLPEQYKAVEAALKRMPKLEKAFETLSKEDEKTKKLLSKEIEKNRALEIIKKKRVNLEYLKCCETYEQYKTICSYWNEITKEEFYILKEVLL